MNCESMQRVEFVRAAGTSPAAKAVAASDMSDAVPPSASVAVYLVRIGARARVRVGVRVRASVAGLGLLGGRV